MRAEAKRSYFPIVKGIQQQADPSDSAVKGETLQQLDLWNQVFESRSEHVCWSVVFDLCCVGIGLCNELITRPEESYLVCRCVFDL